MQTGAEEGEGGDTSGAFADPPASSTSVSSVGVCECARALQMDRQPDGQKAHSGSTRARERNLVFPVAVFLRVVVKLLRLLDSLLATHTYSGCVRKPLWLAVL